MKAIIKTILFIWFVFGLQTATAQTNVYPEIGKKIPEFSLKTEGGTTGEISSASLLGKHYILDFWTTSCSGCVAAFPKMDTLQQNFASGLNVILVGLEEKYRDVRQFYNKYRSKDNLTLTAVFDSTTFRKFVPFFVPHLIWVDKNGIVQAITNTDDVNDENVQKFLNDRHFKFEDVSYLTRMKARTNFEPQKPMLINGNGGSDTCYAFRSIIAFWEPSMSRPSLPEPHPNSSNGRALYQVVAASIDVLFDLAHWGTLEVFKRFPNAYPIPQFSEGATAILKTRSLLNRKFCYSVELPIEVATKKAIMQKMQDDLSSYFGLSSKITEKDMPYYALRIKNAEFFSKIKSGMGKRASTWAAETSKQKFQNSPLDDIIKTITSKVLPVEYRHIINETGYSSNLTFEMEATVYDFESIKEGLTSLGLELVSTTKKFKVLEITEGQ